MMFIDSHKFQRRCICHLVEVFVEELKSRVKKYVQRSMSIYIGFIKEIYQFDSLALRTKFVENEFHANANLEVITSK